MANGLLTDGQDFPVRGNRPPMTGLPTPVTPPPYRPTRPQPATEVLPSGPSGQDRPPTDVGGSPPPMTGLPTPVAPPPSRPVRPKPVIYTRPDVTPSPGPTNDLGSNVSEASGSGGNYMSNASSNVSRRRGVTRYSNPVHPSSSRRRGY